MSKRNKQTITLGSGKLFFVEFTAGEEIPTDAVLEIDDNLLGLIKGGAELAYTPEFYSATDDLGIVKKQIITGEEVTLSSGLMTWNADTLAVLSATGRVTETADKRTLKIGGVGNQTGKQYLLRFVHTDKVDGDVRVTIVGQNTAGFTLSFAPDAETVIDAEFVANPALDKEGTLVIIDEDIKEAVGANLTSDDPETTETAGKKTVQK